MKRNIPPITDADIDSAMRRSTPIKRRSRRDSADAAPVPVPPRSSPPITPTEEPPGPPPPGLAWVCMADVQPEVLEWLCPGKIPLGKITLIAGDPGLGKSLVTVDIAARITRGLAWPDGSPNVPGDVVMLNAEDGIADTIRVRLDAAGADPSRIRVITGTRRPGQPGEAQFSLAQDLARLEDMLAEMGTVRLVVIDPVSAYLGDTDSHRNSDVRALLAPLAAIAAKYRVAIIIVTHLNKGGGSGAMARTTGSLAFPAAARAAWLVAADPEDEDRRIMAPMKMNLAERPTALGFTIVEGPRVAWENKPVNITADALLAALAAKSEQAREGGIDATGWLRELLTPGPLQSKEVQKQARECGIGERRLGDAMRALGVKPRRRGGFAAEGSWWMELPGAPPAREAEPYVPIPPISDTP